MQVTLVDKVADGGKGHCHSQRRARRGLSPKPLFVAPDPLLLVTSWTPTTSVPINSSSGLDPASSSIVSLIVS